MRLASIKLFKVSGIDVEMHFTFHFLTLLLIAEGFIENGVFGACNSLLLLLLFFITILLHELGHALTAQRFEIDVPRILFLPIGGMAQFSHIPKNAKIECLITVAGPAVNFVIFGLISLFLGNDFSQTSLELLSSDFTNALQLWAVLNLLMGLFNLLPIFPMDGGRLLRALLFLKWDYTQATQYAVYFAKIGAGAGIIISLVGGHFLTALLFAFIFIVGELEYKQVKWKERYSGLTIGDVTKPYPIDAPEHLSQLESKAKQRLQAKWPLETFIDLFTKARGSQIFLVYDDIHFVGIISTETFPQNLFWADQRRKLNKVLEQS